MKNKKTNPIIFIAMVISGILLLVTSNEELTKGNTLHLISNLMGIIAGAVLIGAGLYLLFKLSSAK